MRGYLRQVTGVFIFGFVFLNGVFAINCTRWKIQCLLYAIKKKKKKSALYSFYLVLRFIQTFNFVLTANCISHKEIQQSNVTLHNRIFTLGSTLSTFFGM